MKDVLIFIAAFASAWVMATRIVRTNFENRLCSARELAEAMDKKNVRDMQRLYVELRRTSLELIAAKRESAQWRDLWKRGMKQLPPALTDCLNLLEEDPAKKERK